MTFIEEAIISGFIGKAISDCNDISWTKIKEAVKNRKNKHQNGESQIYNVIVNVLNKITYNKFEYDQDKIYQAAEKLLMGYKDDRCDSIEVVKSGLQLLGESIDRDKYMEFKMQLYQEISKSDYEELYRKIGLLKQDEESDKTSRIEKKVDKLQQSADKTNRRLNVIQKSNVGINNARNKKPVKSKTQKYADKWNANMFLNDFDEWDENAGVNVKLSDVYINEHLPHFINKNSKNESDNLDVLLSQYITKSNYNKMLLVLGHPGIGKSTLITWITVNFADRINDILVYRFAPDLRNVDWKDERISNRVLEELGLEYNDLNGKVLILDGFDEVSIEANRRKDILDSIYSDWIYDRAIDNFSLIITCRENYVPQLAILKCKYITLQPWNEMQTRSFCNIFQEKTKNSVYEGTIEKLIEMRSIFGIPLILYMVLALNISIEKEGSIVDIYDKIFSLEGGIYDRCIDNKMFADKHRIGVIKKQIHQISRKIAIWMFENNPEGASVSQKEYVNICDQVKCTIVTENVELEQDFKIGSYFKLIKHCEGMNTEELSFVHRSIYEYFVVETICNSIEGAILELSEKSQEKLAENIAGYLKEGHLTNTIKDYLKYKILKIYYRLNNEKRTRFYLWWEEAIKKMMDYGMFYYTGDNIQRYENILVKEAQCFENLVKILRLLQYANRNEYIFEKADKEQLERYVWLVVSWKKQQGKLDDVDLSNMFLKDTNLRGLEYKFKYLQAANLSGSNLGKAVLIDINLQETNLQGANLSEADLRRADLRKVNLQKTDLHDTDLRSADLRGADLYRANLFGTQLDNSIWLIEDVFRLALDLEKAQFVQIIVENHDNKKQTVYKNQICFTH